MKVFNLDPEKYKESYEVNGYAHVKGGVDQGFLSYAQAVYNKQAGTDNDMKDWAFKGKKLQFLFEFPEETDLVADVKQVVGGVAGEPVERITLSERHIKSYDSHAPANAPAHKDRLASSITVGLPLYVPEGSYLILYPNDYLTINPYNTTALWRTSLDEKDLPENVLKDIEPEKAYVEPGDVVLFKGNSIYHERVNPANTVLLYLKFSTIGLDPIAEDPATVIQRDKSLELLKARSDDELLVSKVMVSPRLEKMTRIYTRLYWKEVIQANVAGEKEFTLEEEEFQIFKNINGKSLVKDVLERLGQPTRHYQGYIPRLRRLIALGGIDLIG